MLLHAIMLHARYALSPGTAVVCSLTIECVLLLYNAFFYYRMRSLTSYALSPGTAVVRVVLRMRVLQMELHQIALAFRKHSDAVEGAFGPLSARTV